MKKRKKMSLFGIILGILLIIMTISLIVLINTFNVIPDNYYILIIVFLISSNIILNLLLMFNFKNKFLKVMHIISYVITILLLISFSFGIFYLNKTMNLFDNFNVIKEEVTDYYIIVLNDSVYQEPSDLYEKTLEYYDKTDKEVLDSIKLSLTYSSTSDINSLKDNLFNHKVE